MCKFESFLVQSFFEESLQHCDEWRKFTSDSQSVIQYSTQRAQICVAAVSVVMCRSVEVGSQILKYE